MKYIFMIIAMAMIWGCAPKADNEPGAQQGQTAQSNLKADGIEGIWVKPVIGQPGNTDGMELNPDGTVTTINMATLTYKSWKRNGDTLTLTGLSEGNGTSSDFSFDYKIKELTPERLVLVLDGAEFVYTRAQK